MRIEADERQSDIAKFVHLGKEQVVSVLPEGWPLTEVLPFASVEVRLASCLDSCLTSGFVSCFASTLASCNADDPTSHQALYGCPLGQEMPCQTLLHPVKSSQDSQ